MDVVAKEWARCPSVWRFLRFPWVEGLALPIVPFRGVTARLLLTALLVCPALGKLLLSQQTPALQHSESAIIPGVVVEKIVPNGEAEKAGLKEGDILLGWSRDGSKGEIQSPFDVSWAEMEQASLGTVRLEGMRGTEEQSWSVGPDVWGLSTRPNFTGEVLSAYRKAQELAQSGKADAIMEAAQDWKSLANQAPVPQTPWIPAWLLFHGAELLKDARQWKDADDLYPSAVRDAAGSPVIEGQILRAWARVYQQRNDWANAEKYFQQSTAKIESSGGGKLAITANLINLGSVAWSRGELAQAERYYRQALDEREKLAPGSLGVAASLGGLGLVATDRGDLAKAEQYLRQALDIREKVAPGSLGVAASFNNLANVAWKRGDLAQAEQYHRQALDLRQKLAPGTLDVASSLNNLGTVAWKRGNLAQAEQYHRQALDLREKLAPGSLDVASSFDNLAIVSYEQGDLATGEQYFERALEIKQKLAPGSMDVAASLNNLGLIAVDRGDLAKGEQYERQALDLREKLAPGRLDVAASLHNLGIVAWKRGDLAKATRYFEKALEIKQKLAPESIDLARSLDNLGSVLREGGDLARAEQYLRQALDIREKVAPGSLDVALSLHNLGLVAEDRGDWAKAEQYQREALAIHEKLAPESVYIAQVLCTLGDLARRSGDSPGAEGFYHRAAVILEKLAPGSEEYAESLAGSASILRDGQQLDAAAQFYARAVAALESQTEQLGGSEDVRSGFRAKYSGIFRDYVDLLVEQKQPERALEMLERSRARILLEMLASAHVDVHQGADPVLLQQERSLQELITAKSGRRLRLMEEKKNEQQIAAFAREIENLEKQYQDVEERLRLNSPAYAALTQPQPLTAGEIQELLGSDTLLLEYSLGEKRSYVFAVTAESVTVRELPQRAQIEKAAAAAYSVLSSSDIAGRGQTSPQARPKHPVSYGAAARRLSAMVLAPMVDQLQDKRLLIVSDGALEYIPFAALPAPQLKPGATINAPLIAQHEIVNLPSASTLAVLRSEASRRATASKAVMVLADPVFDSHDGRVRPSHALQVREGPSPQAIDRSWLNRSANDAGVSRDGLFRRLPFTRLEAQTIYSTAAPGEAAEALDFDASKATAMSRELEDYRIVHLATHGLLDSRHPELSGLVFSLVDRKGRAQEGFLRLPDVYNLELNAELVVLSACQTALGKQVEGEGLIGLARGFMYAGSPRVVASLWKVNDQATAKLMGKFYAGLLKEHQTPAQALRAAQRWMQSQKRWKAPYYWAGFLLLGEWK